MLSKKSSALALSSFWGLIAIAMPVNAGTTAKENCYMRDGAGKVSSLDKICGKFSPTAATIDLDTDLDRNGVADALTAEVKKLDAAKTVEAQGAILEDFVKRLPYSAETRAIAEKSKGLHEQLMKAKTSGEADAIKAKMAAFEQQALKDPGYVKSMKALEQLTAPKVTGQLKSSIGGKTDLASVLERDQNGTKVAFTGASENQGSDVPTLDLGLQNIDTQTSQTVAAVDTTGLRRGDVMLIKSANKSIGNYTYAITYNHAGSFEQFSQVYESNPNEGAKVKAVGPWLVAGSGLALGRSNQKTIAQVQTALTNAESKYGTNGRTPYNYNFVDKNTDNAVYCSQLVWKIHKSLGVDIDSNDNGYKLALAARASLFGIAGAAAAATVAQFAVAPDEIAKSGYISFYAVGTI